MTAPPKPVSGQEGFFWKTKTLDEMSDAEWESLCDGCARCCLEKLEDEDTGKIYFTHVACRLLDHKTARCTDYRHRKAFVPDCLRLTPKIIKDVPWLPSTCAYRRRAARFTSTSTTPTRFSCLARTNALRLSRPE